MLISIVVLFALAAVAGLILFTALARNKETPKGVVAIHGLLAATALVLLIMFVLSDAATLPRVALALFVIAALGGFYLLTRDLRGKPGPIAVAVIHALMAVAGFGSLLYFVFRQ